MSWNYRLLATKNEFNDVFMEVHEVYYDTNGKINGYTEKPVTIGGESTEVIKWQLSMIKLCLDKEILDKNNFPNAFL